MRIIIGTVTIFQCGGCDRLSTDREYCCGRENGAFTYPVYGVED